MPLESTLSGNTVSEDMARVSCYSVQVLHYQQMLDRVVSHPALL